MIESILQTAESFSLAPIRKLAALVQSLDRIPGDIVEVGCFLGGSAIAMAAAAPQRKIISIDTFSGLPEPVECDGPGHHKGEMSAGRDTVLHNTKGFPNIMLVAGDVRITLPGGPACPPIVLLFLDCDLYESYAAALRLFWPAIVPGGLAVFDDYLVEDCPGATKAVDEFFPGGLVEERFGMWCVEK